MRGLLEKFCVLEKGFVILTGHLWLVSGAVPLSLVLCPFLTLMVGCVGAQYLDQEDSSRPIYMYINCPGGSVIAGLAIYDVMQLIR